MDYGTGGFMISLKDIANAVEKVAPAVAAGLLGPWGGSLVAMLETMLGVKSGDLPAAIVANPQAANDLAESLAKIQAENYVTEVDDRKSARDREESIVKTLGKRDWVLDFIAMLVVSGFFAMAFLIAIAPMDRSDHDILYMIIGQLTSGFLLVLGYYFGSSKKSSN
jgi:cell division protein FtsX